MITGEVHLSLSLSYLARTRIAAQRCREPIAFCCVLTSPTGFEASWQLPVISGPVMPHRRRNQHAYSMWRGCASYAHETTLVSVYARLFGRVRQASSVHRHDVCRVRMEKDRHTICCLLLASITADTAE